MAAPARSRSWPEEVGLLGKFLGRGKSTPASAAELYPFDHPHEVAPRALAALLGGKGANLAEAVGVLDLPVPPGFTIPTNLCREYLEDGWPEGLDAAIAGQMARLERQTGRAFGGSDKPLRRLAEPPRGPSFLVAQDRAAGRIRRSRGNAGQLERFGVGERSVATRVAKVHRVVR